MSKLRIAVVGGGHLGSIHARLLQQVPDVELAAIVEPSESRAEELRQSVPSEIFTNVDRFIETTDVDGVILAAPTTLHHDLGTRLLHRGIHCLIEKPLAPTAWECEELVAAAKASNTILQVGHVERFNPAWNAMQNAIGAPRIIQANREGSLTFRSLDAGVVLDLMIHDIDLVLSLVKSPVANVSATGLQWTGPSEDFAQARITFADGCIANFTASRISCEPRRTMRVFGRDWYSEIDFGNRTCHVIDAPQHKKWQSRPYSQEERQSLMNDLFERVTPRHDLTISECNPILDEQCDFATSIRTNSQPIVSGEAGLAAVDIANQVLQKMSRRPAVAPNYRKAG